MTIAAPATGETLEAQLEEDTFERVLNLKRRSHQCAAVTLPLDPIGSWLIHL